jgi:hypothetical protein
MYLNSTIKDVICYRSKNHYDAEIMISTENFKTQRVIKSNCATYEEAEKVSSDYCLVLQIKMDEFLKLSIKDLQHAKE